MRNLAFAILLCVGASPALADMSECDSYASNVEMSQCALQQYEAADAELNDVWKQVVASIKATDTDVMPTSEMQKWLGAMTDAERAWATFKDNDCKGGVSYEWYGGTGAGLAVSTCLYDHTVQRIKDLRARYLNN